MNSQDNNKSIKDRSFVPQWALEHGKEYDVPEAIDNLVKEGKLEDISYGNDTCPRFQTKDTRYNIWCEHPNADIREIQKTRYSIVEMDEDDFVATILKTDEIEEVIEWLGGKK